MGGCEGCGRSYWFSAGGGELTVLDWSVGVRGDPWEEAGEEGLVAVRYLLVWGVRLDWLGR